MSEKPTQIRDVNLEALREVCQEYLDFFEDEDYIEDRLGDYKHFIFEAAMNAVFGEKVFQWITSKMNERDKEL